MRLLYQEMRQVEDDWYSGSTDNNIIISVKKIYETDYLDSIVIDIQNSGEYYLTKNYGIAGYRFGISDLFARQAIDFVKSIPHTKLNKLWFIDNYGFNEINRPFNISICGICGQEFDKNSMNRITSSSLFPCRRHMPHGNSLMVCAQCYKKHLHLG